MEDDKYLIYNPLIWLMLLAGLGWMACDYLLHLISKQFGFGWVSALVDIDWND